MGSKRDRSRRLIDRPGFTLIELLVVVSVIALLIAILLPALAKARISAMLVQDTSNARQWGMACQSYAADHKGFLPPGDDGNPGLMTWVWMIEPTWLTLHHDYGMPEEASMCMAYEGQTQHFFINEFSPDIVSVGWIYFGNRNDEALGQTHDGKDYITPKKVDDHQATSSTLLTCFHYDGATAGRPWGNWIPHSTRGWGAAYHASGSLGGDIRNSGFSGLNVALIDGSASWVGYDDLARFQQAEYLYYQPK